MDVIGQFGGEVWFNFGDCDLVIYVQCMLCLWVGVMFSDVIDELCSVFSICLQLVLMSDDLVCMVIEMKDDGDFVFQYYFVCD